MLHFPPDHFDEYSGRVFWSGLKRCPQVIDLDIEDQIVFEFIRAGTEILAKMLNIQSPKNKT